MTKAKTTIDTLMSLSFVHGLSLSPQKDRAAFIKTRINEAKNRYDHEIWQVDDQGELRRLVSDRKVAQFFYGKSEADLADRALYFTAAHRDEEAPERQKKGLTESIYYRLNLTHGGEAEQAFTLPFAVAQLVARKDGRFFVVADLPKDDPLLFLKDASEQQKTHDEKEKLNFCHRFEEIPFYFNGAGYIYGSVQKLYLFDPKRRKEINAAKTPDERLDAYGLQELLPEVYQLLSVEQNEKEDRLLLMHSPVSARMELNQALDEYHITFDEKGHATLAQLQTQVPLEAKMNLHRCFYFKEQAYLFASDRSRIGLNQNSNLYRLPSLEKVCEREFLLGSSVGSDARFGGSKSYFIDDAYYCLTTDWNMGKMLRIDPETGDTKALDTGLSLDAFVRFENKNAVAIALTPTHPQEIYLLKEVEKDAAQSYPFDPKSYEITQAYHPDQLSHFNDREDQQGHMPQRFVIESNGDPIEYFVLLPEGGEATAPTARIPAILDIHGGPKTVYGGVYFHEMQLWRDRGFAVFFANPHGGDGRDDRFSDIRGRYGEIDYSDLMNVCDDVLRRFPQIDPERLGVTGGSYGGFMTNWIITHTDRFKAAATQRSIMNWLSFYGTSDIGFYFATDQTGALTDSEEGFMKMWRQSPLRYINHAKTPTLIIHSEEDYRCPLEQAQQLMTALVDRGIEARMVQFKGENHELSRSGRPQARRMRLQEITEWMEKHLMPEKQAQSANAASKTTVQNGEQNP